MTSSADGFQKAHKSKLNSLSVKVRSFDEQLDEARKTIGESELLQSLRNSLDSFHITHMRCLALGSFTQDSPARFQLALLLELLDTLKVSKCSLYDPAFDDEDLAYINDMERQSSCVWSVDERSPFLDVHSEHILFFLPHAPLSLTEKVISEESPQIWLANHLIQHTDRFTKLQLYTKYPLVSKLVHHINSATVNKVSLGAKADDDGFQPFTSSRKRKSQRRNKFKEPAIEYDTVESYFKSCKITNDFEDGTTLTGRIWLNSFSDLALHLIET
ncbi:unnamed protein product [Kluyveromyces dobzhanskii CBS 2104]|uniref:WGS project CCBQ000000000 data, contig 00016 n=1 Tax=Kluyveromyces dobzhanskii CBS 2104 TaxID=1427455 RepID=A0A0A8L1R2_9SACH|nr:unnamed protein product [Kluyveromyces dobzhanskii CBS 2104]